MSIQLNYNLPKAQAVDSGTGLQVTHRIHVAQHHEHQGLYSAPILPSETTREACPAHTNTLYKLP
jgi:hypothetical protein